MSNQLKLVFGISLNPDPKVIRHLDLVDKLSRFNRDKRYRKESEVSLKDFCKINNIDYSKEIDKPVNVLRYHSRFSKRSYNKVNRI